MRNGITVAGSIAYDEIKKIKNYPKKSELATILEFERSCGGAVSNCSISLAKIDPSLPIEVVSLIGDDGRGEFLYNCLNKYENINLNQLQTIGATTFTDVIQDLSDNSRTFLTYPGNAVLFTEDKIDFKNLNAKIFHIAYLLLLEGLDKKDSEYGTKMAKVLNEAQQRGMKTSIDIVSENSNRYEEIVQPSLKYTNYCIINEIEAGSSVGINLRNENNELIIENIKPVLKMLKSFGVKDWVIIHTPESSFGYDGSMFLSVPSLLIEKSLIKGTVGAGDAYLSGVLYAAHNDKSLKEAMELGTATAAASLFESDSVSGMKSYKELLTLYSTFEKRDEILL